MYRKNKQAFVMVNSLERRVDEGRCIWVEKRKILFPKKLGNKVVTSKELTGRRRRVGVVEGKGLPKKRRRENPILKRKKWFSYFKYNWRMTILLNIMIVCWRIYICWFSPDFHNFSSNCCQWCANWLVQLFCCRSNRFYDLPPPPLHHRIHHSIIHAEPNFKWKIVNRDD